MDEKVTKLVHGKTIREIKKSLYGITIVCTDGTLVDIDPRAVYVGDGVDKLYLDIAISYPYIQKFTTITM